MSNDFTKIFEDAEKQVSGIKSEKLREIAFGKLVSHLLGSNSSDDDDDGGAESTKPKARTKRVASKSIKPGATKPKVSKGKETISIVKDLNLREKGKKSFKDFYQEKQPKSAMHFNVVAIYYLERILELNPITASHVYTCYKEVTKRPPDAFAQSL